ncbi:putative IQ motif, EF-hand binding protein [Helianthus annuus]|nr:putative IQ motif, EF-hand binding protein [Helianthus annuus]KAJ0814817.1 putative IQ motif, EF-hand binding protein [Helianthus annuus]KAJ0828039.1 putative IQ motif, EF-hand binding protein [Helianthus annuus]
MAKRRWLTLIKRFFISETCQNRSKEKKIRWVFGRHKLKRLTSQSAVIERPKSAEKKVKPPVVVVVQETDESIQVLGDDGNAAAIKIQTAFRGFLARKALRALKGVVRLQAMIRGHLVRHQAVTTLKRLQSVVNIQSQTRAKRIQVANCSCHDNYQEHRGKDIKIDMNSQKRWDDSILTKEEEGAMLFGKREAAMKRERIREYALSHRMSTESEQSKVNMKWRYWLERWVDTELAKREDLQNLGKTEDFESQKVKLRNLKLTDTPNHHLPRTTHHRKQRSIGEEHLGSPVFPTYMAATESARARARARSLSSPRLRPLSVDTWSASNSPYKQKLLSPISSINSDASSISQVWNANRRVGYSQRSPSLNGFTGHVKASKTLKNLSFSSESSVPNWDQIGNLR